MAELTKQKIRAEILFGGMTIETPNVMSFNVRRARGQMCATFSASVKVSSSITATDIDASEIIIKAGSEGNLKTIFTGKIFKCTATPIRTDASKIMLNLSGKDVLHRLEGQKINRRVTTYRDGTTPPQRWGVVTSVTRENTPIKQKFKTKVASHEPVARTGWEIEDVIITPPPYFDRNVVSKDYIGSGEACEVTLAPEEETE